MGIFKFTSPEGTEYYGEGASMEDAFGSAKERDPNELAAMRTRQSVRHGAPEPDIEIPEAAEAVKRGDYGPLREQAFDAATSLGRTAMPMVGAMADVLSPTATAGGMFDAEPDAKKRRALQKQYDDAGPKGKREIIGAFNAEQSQIVGEQRRVAEEERQAGTTKKNREDWLRDNEEAIKSLKPQWQQQIAAAGSLPDAQEMFNRGMAERKQAGMTIAERYPAAVGALEAAGMAGAAYLPGRMAAGRSRTIKEATTDAERAYQEAYGRGSKPSKGAQSEAALAENILKHAAKLKQVSLGEVAGGVAAPWIAGQAPNFFDWTMGQLESDPAAQEKVQRAHDNILSLGPVERALIEGGSASWAGSWLGSGRRDFGAAKGRAEGVLDTFAAREAAAKEATAKREQARAKANLTKALKQSERSNVELLRPQSPFIPERSN